MRLKVSNVCQLLDKSKFPATHTQLGCTFTNNGDGSFTINGTIQNGGSWSYSLQQITQNLYGHKILLLTNSTSDIVRGEMKFTLQNGSSRWGTYNSIYTVIYDDYQYIAIRIYMDNVDAGKTIDNATVKFQLFDLTEMYGAGNEPTTIAQFRQDFPNEMYDYSNVCWKKFRRLKYVTETKNLFDIRKVGGLISAQFYDISQYLTKNLTQNSLTVRYGGYANTAFLKGPIVLSAGTYTFSCNFDYDAPNNNSCHLSVGKKAIDKKEIVIISETPFTQSHRLVLTFTLAEETEVYLSLQGDGGPDNYLNLNNVFFNIQLEKGSTASPYQPYGYLPLNRGKYIANKEPVQLLDKTEFPATTTLNGVTFTNNGDGTITANGTSTKNYASYSIIKIPRPPIGHKILVLPENNFNTQNHIYIYGSNDKGVWVDDLGYGGNIITITGIGNTLKNPYTRIGINLNVNKDWVMNNHIYKPQLFDLTEMYGAGHEPTTVEQFRADFPNELYDYNPYNAITFR